MDVKRVSQFLFRYFYHTFSCDIVVVLLYCKFNLFAKFVNIWLLTDWLTEWWIDWLIDRSIDRSIDWLINPSINQSVCLSVSRSVSDKSVSQSVSQSVNISHSFTRSFKFNILKQHHNNGKVDSKKAQLLLWRPQIINTYSWTNTLDITW